MFRMYYEVNEYDSGKGFLNIDCKVLKESILIDSFNIMYCIKNNSIYSSYDNVKPNDEKGLYDISTYGYDMYLGRDNDDWDVYVDPYSEFPLYQTLGLCRESYNYINANLDNIKEDLKQLYCDTMLL